MPELTEKERELFMKIVKEAKTREELLDAVLKHMAEPAPARLGRTISVPGTVPEAPPPPVMTEPVKKVYVPPPKVAKEAPKVTPSVSAAKGPVPVVTAADLSRRRLKKAPPAKEKEKPAPPSWVKPKK